jgi:hypothetical protein
MLVAGGLLMISGAVLVAAAAPIGWLFGAGGLAVLALGRPRSD